MRGKTILAAAIMAAVAAVFTGGAVEAAATADAIACGKRVFNRCKACHTLRPGGKQARGPSLHGIFGIRAGTVDGYDNYSDALKGSEIVWDEAAMDAFLAKPRKVVPGNSMAFSGLRKKKQRDCLIAYMMEETR